MFLNPKEYWDLFIRTHDTAGSRYRRGICSLMVFLVVAVAILQGQSPAERSLQPESMGADVQTRSHEYLFKKHVDEVNLFFTVVDRRGKFINDLTLEDLKLLDNQLPPAKVHFFQQETDVPLRVAVVVDTSGSVIARFQYEQETAIHFFKKILRPSMDKGLVLGFNKELRLEQDLTNDLPALEQAVKRLTPGGETALYDAIAYAADKLRSDPDNGTRRVIIVVSDGENNASVASMKEAEQAALGAEAPIYTLSTNDIHTDDHARGEEILTLLSDHTGGELMRAREDDQVARAFRKVEQALRSQYVLSYKPDAFAHDGRFRQVELTTRDAKLRVECRPGYYAPRD